MTFAIFKLGLRIRLKYFFGATGTLLYILVFILAGNGIKELQAGWLAAQHAAQFSATTATFGNISDA
jgi:high-affinity iron transporter